MAGTRKTGNGKTERELPRFSDSMRVLVSGKKAHPVSVSSDQTVYFSVYKLAKVLGKPGVDKAALFSSPKTPVFRAHPSEPGLLIRYFRDGKEETGRITAAGTFKVIKRR